MKIISTLFVFMALTQFGFAQPVISNVEPLIGDQFVYTQADNTDYAHGMPGANMYWDFSDLYAQALNDLEYTVLDPSAGASEEFPEATSIWFGEYFFGDTEDYLNFDSGSMTTIGKIPLGMGDEKYYSDPEQNFLFPLAYEDSGTDAFEGLYINSFWQIEEEFYGTSMYDVNGYGTVETQYGVFSDVLLVTTYKEEFVIDDFENMDVKYLAKSAWYSGLYPVPVLMVTTTFEIENLGSLFEEASDTLIMVSALETYNGAITKVDENSAENPFTIYPNPASEYIVVNAETEGKVALKIFSADGKLVIEQSVQNQEKIYVNELSSGYYIAILTIDGTQFKPYSFVVF